MNVLTDHRVDNIIRSNHKNATAAKNLQGKFYKILCGFLVAIAFLGVDGNDADQKWSKI